MQLLNYAKTSEQTTTNSVKTCICQLEPGYGLFAIRLYTTANYLPTANTANVNAKHSNQH